MKPLTFILIGLTVFAVLVGIFYYISIPVLTMPIIKSIPRMSWIFWLIIVGGSAVLTAGIMREIYDINKRPRRRR